MTTTNTLTTTPDYDFRALSTSINQIATTPSLILDVIFKTKNQNFGTSLDIDVLGDAGTKLAPFVAPMQAGKVVQALSRSTKNVKFPRIRLKKQLPAKDLMLTRDLGQSVYLGEGKSPTDAVNSKLAREQQHLKNLITRRIEWMAAQALAGSVSYQSDDVTFTIDFGVPESHKPELTGTSVWGGEDADILGDIRSWKNKILQATNLTADKALIGSQALDILLEDEKIRKMLDNRNLNAGAMSIDNSAFVGRLCGVDIYECAEQYIDDEGAAHNMIDEKAFVLLASAGGFVQEYGLIEDLEAQVALSFFSKLWYEKDPSSAWLLAESNPLPVVYQPEAIVYATVA